MPATPPQGRGWRPATRRDVPAPPLPRPARAWAWLQRCMYDACAHACTASRCMCMCAARVGAAPRRPRCPLSRTIGERGQKVRGRRTVGVTHSGPCLPARPGDRVGEMAMVLPVRGRPGLQSVPLHMVVHMRYDISCKCKSKALTPPSHTKMRAVAWRAWLRARFRMAEGVACRHPPQGIQPWVSCQPTAYVLARAFTA